MMTGDQVGRTSPERCPGRGEGLLQIALGLVLLARVVYGAWLHSPTIDEPKHLLTGQLYLAHGWCCSGKDNTPLSVLNAAPLYFRAETPLLAPEEVLALYRGELPRDTLRQRYFLARSVNVLWMAVLAWGLVRFLSRGFGARCATLGLGFLALSPNLVAYGSLVNPDFHLAVMMFVAMIALTRFFEKSPGPWSVLCLSLGLALAFLSKYSAMVLIPGALLAFFGLGVLRGSLRTMRRHGFGLVAALLLSILWVDLAYRLPDAIGGFKALGWFPFQGDNTAARVLAGAVDPPEGSVSYGFWGGLQEVRRISAIGFPSFFRGEVAHDFAWYYPVALLIKVPIALLVGAALGGGMLLKDRARWPLLLAFVVPLSGLLVGAMMSEMCLGVRHVLPLLPFFIMLTAIAVHRLLSGQELGSRKFWGMTQRLLGVGIVGTMLISSVSQFTQPLSYFNELVGGRLRATTTWETPTLIGDRIFIVWENV